MSALKKHRGGRLPFHRGKAPPKNEKKTFEPQNCGDLDYDMLADEVIAKFPKILARLAQ